MPSAPRARLPEVPEVRGPLDLVVRYPARGALVGGADSGFAFGSLGTGGATLTINQQPVHVWPNGAWLAWIALPSGPESALDLVAAAGPDTVRLTHPIRRPARFEAPVAGAWIDPASLQPRGDLWVQPGESVALAARAVPGAAVRVILPDGRRVPLVPAPLPQGRDGGLDAFGLEPAGAGHQVDQARFTGELSATPIGRVAGGFLPQFSAGGLADSVGLTVEAIVRGDTARAPWPLAIAIAPAGGLPVRLHDDLAGTGLTDGIVVGRAAPGATYHWFLPNGTRARAVERRGDAVRVQLAAGRSAWVAASELLAEPAAIGRVPATIGSISPEVTGAGVGFRIPVGDRIPFRVVESPRRLVLELYGAVSDINWVRHRGTDHVVEGIRWDQPASDVVTLTFDLVDEVWGYRTGWAGGDLVLEIRQPPAIDQRRPLRGRTIVVDAGHPPAGATGPTGLGEAEANLGVALALARLLEEDGATVIQTRPDARPVGLWERVRDAEAAGGEILVSIHNNALPDGVNPFTSNGTSVFYNHPRSRALARAVQRGLLERLGMRDLGYTRADLALVRPTWMPAILTEGLFMMLPDQEHALRTPEGQRQYAEGVRDGLVRFLGERAESRPR